MFNMYIENIFIFRYIFVCMEIATELFFNHTSIVSGNSFEKSILQFVPKIKPTSELILSITCYPRHIIV